MFGYGFGRKGFTYGPFGTTAFNLGPYGLGRDTPAVDFGFLLQEILDYLLQETGDKLIKDP